MKTIVCVKQVPDTTGTVKINENGTLDRASMKAIINPDDLYAVEQALRLKDAVSGTVAVLSMGPASAEPMLRELLAMGCDEAVLISGREFAGSDTLGTSQILAAAICNYGFDKDTLILCGRQTIDGGTAQVGPQVAERLGIPQVTCVSEIEFSEGRLFCHQKRDDATLKVAVPVPCLVTIVKNECLPRYMSVNGIMDAYRKPLFVYDYSMLRTQPLMKDDCIGAENSATKICKSFTVAPEMRQMTVFPCDRGGCREWIRYMRVRKTV